MRSEAPVVWLIRSRGGEPRRVHYGYRKPALKPDEFAYRIVLPSVANDPHQVVRLGTVRLRRSRRRRVATPGGQL